MAIDEGEARALIANWHTTYPGVQRFLSKVRAQPASARLAAARISLGKLATRPARPQDMSALFHPLLCGQCGGAEPSFFRPSAVVSDSLHCLTLLGRSPFWKLSRRQSRLFRGCLL